MMKKKKNERRRAKKKHNISEINGSCILCGNLRNATNESHLFIASSQPLSLARMRQRDKENDSTNYETAKVIMKNWFAKFHIKCDVTIGMCTLDLNEPRND